MYRRGDVVRAVPGGGIAQHLWHRVGRVLEMHGPPLRVGTPNVRAVFPDGHGAWDTWLHATDLLPADEEDLIVQRALDELTS